MKTFRLLCTATALLFALGVLAKTAHGTTVGANDYDDEVLYTFNTLEQEREGSKDDENFCLKNPQLVAHSFTVPHSSQCSILLSWSDNAQENAGKVPEWTEQEEKVFDRAVLQAMNDDSDGDFVAVSFGLEASTVAVHRHLSLSYSVHDDTHHRRLGFGFMYRGGFACGWFCFPEDQDARRKLQDEPKLTKFTLDKAIAKVGIADRILRNLWVNDESELLRTTSCLAISCGDDDEEEGYDVSGGTECQEMIFQNASDDEPKENKK